MIKSPGQQVVLRYYIIIIRRPVSMCTRARHETERARRAHHLPNCNTPVKP